MSNILPPPPAIIKLKPDFSQGLDLRNPIHAAAYLKAASHFLAGWPQDWSAERLCLAMIDEESPDQKEVNYWECIAKDVHAMDDARAFVEELIDSLAEDFLAFLSENQ